MGNNDKSIQTLQKAAREFAPYPLELRITNYLELRCEEVAFWFD
jgi:hypothetical protein